MDVWPVYIWPADVWPMDIGQVNFFLAVGQMARDFFMYHFNMVLTEITFVNIASKIKYVIFILSATKRCYNTINTSLTGLILSPTKNCFGKLFFSFSLTQKTYYTYYAPKYSNTSKHCNIISTVINWSNT